VTENDDLDELKAFLFEQVETLEELAILAFLHARGSEGATQAAVAQAIGFPPAVTLRALEQLCTRGTISCSALEPAEYRFEPTSATRAMFERVFRQYNANPLGLMKFMTANAIERVRTAALRTFADAFRIGGPKSNG
jgi:hypothetical protein